MSIHLSWQRNIFNLARVPSRWGILLTEFTDSAIFEGRFGLKGIVKQIVSVAFSLHVLVSPFGLDYWWSLESGVFVL